MYYNSLKQIFVCLTQALHLDGKWSAKWGLSLWIVINKANAYKSRARYTQWLKIN